MSCYDNYDSWSIIFTFLISNNLVWINIEKNITYLIFWGKLKAAVIIVDLINHTCERLIVFDQISLKEKYILNWDLDYTTSPQLGLL